MQYWGDAKQEIPDFDFMRDTVDIVHGTFRVVQIGVAFQAERLFLSI